MAETDSPPSAPRPHAIVAGFGIPGREVVNLLKEHDYSICVVELNAQTVARCAQGGLEIIEGDAADESTLHRAGIDRAALLAIAIPDDPAVLKVVAVARKLNPGCRVLARCRRVSTALQAHKLGAEDAVSEEQVIAAEFRRLTASIIGVGIEPPSHR